MIPELAGLTDHGNQFPMTKGVCERSTPECRNGLYPWFVQRDEVQNKQGGGTR